jgi:hypothetical protein
VSVDRSGYMLALVIMVVFGVVVGFGGGYLVRAALQPGIDKQERLDVARDTIKELRIMTEATVTSLKICGKCHEGVE